MIYEYGVFVADACIITNHRMGCYVEKVGAQVRLQVGSHDGGRVRCPVHGCCFQCMQLLPAECNYCKPPSARATSPPTPPHDQVHDPTCIH